MRARIGVIVRCARIALYMASAVLAGFAMVSLSYSAVSLVVLGRYGDAALSGLLFALFLVFYIVVCDELLSIFGLDME